MLASSCERRKVFKGCRYRIEARRPLLDEALEQECYVAPLKKTLVDRLPCLVMIW